jgi:signal transduction histidine kinase
MSFEDHPEFADQVADLNRYGRALNQCESVDEVVSLTVEAINLLFGFRNVTFVEVRGGDLRVAGGTDPDLSAGDTPSAVAREAYDTAETVTTADGGREALAVPAAIVDEVTAVIVVRSDTVESFTDVHVTPLEILASHAATAISNIRSRERLERARQDLETRKEMVEMYDRLLRHDIGNDLQVIAGFAEAVGSQVDDQQAGEYVEKIERSARNSADLIDRVGDLVSTLEEQREPEPRDLRSILEPTVADVTSQYESLSVEFDPAAFEYQVFAGDLLDSVFTNLLSNAAVHNDGEVTVEIYCDESGTDTVAVGMADDGTGIPESVREDLFEMGVKGPDSGGTGFGLGFVRALVESYGGAVSVDDSHLGGAEFRVSLELV